MTALAKLTTTLAQWKTGIPDVALRLFGKGGS